MRYIDTANCTRRIQRPMKRPMVMIRDLRKTAGALLIQTASSAARLNLRLPSHIAL